MSQPTFASARAALEHAFALYSNGDLDGARSILAAVTDATPGYFDAFHLLGVVCLQRGETLDGAKYLGRALQINPDANEVRLQCGLAWFEAGHAQEALEQFEAALERLPGHAQALNYCGVCLKTLGKNALAAARFEAATSADPQFAEAFFNLGSTMLALSDHVRALAAFDAAIALQPDYAEALYNRGVALFATDQIDAAIASFDGALLDKPELDTERGYAALARWHRCDWRDYPFWRQRIIDLVHQQRTTVGLQFLAVSGSAADQLAFGRAATANLPQVAAAPLLLPPRGKRIRVAYVSADFRDHAVSYLMAGVIARHDRARFEIIGVSLLNAKSDALQQLMKERFDRWLDASDMSDQQVTATLRQMEVHVAVDLGGLTGGARRAIFTRRSAPVQVNYLGYPATLGGDEYEALLADRYVIPESLQRFYSEKVVYLPHCYQANDDAREPVGHSLSRRDVGLPENAFVFCSFHTSYKVTPTMFTIWMELLQAAPGSVLWILAHHQATELNLIKEAAARGIAKSRLVFARHVPYALHLERLALADLCLDTLPFNGGTTTSDALWSGLLMLTCPGEAFAARMSGSLLQAIGLPELIATDLNDYRRIALSLANDPVRHQQLTKRLRHNRLTMPLFDTASFTRELEHAFETMVDSAYQVD
jgi:predicted O-linked N-acetylglucosamine transferase (SPINDLY family)